MLRETAGVDKFAAGVAAEVQRLFDAGALPAETDCVRCGRTTDACVQFEVACERPQAKNMSRVGYFIQMMFLILFTPLWFLFWMGRRLNARYNNPEIQGHELVVNAALRICPDCQSSARLSHKHAKSFMMQTEIYRDLFEQYPSATLHRLSGKR